MSKSSDDTTEKDKKSYHEKIRVQDIYPDTGMLVPKDQLEIIRSLIRNQTFMNEFKKTGYHKMEKGTVLQVGNKKIVLERSLNFDENYENCYIFHRGKGIETEEAYESELDKINTELMTELDKKPPDHKKIEELDKEKKKLKESQQKKYLLGKGGFGKVKLAQNVETGVMGSVKIQTIESDKRKTRVQKEGSATAKLSPSIQQTLRKRRTEKTEINVMLKNEKGEDIQCSAILPKREIDSDKEIYQKSLIFMPLYAGSLWSQAFNSFAERLDVAISISEDYLNRFYKPGLLHRDIKGGNIVIVEKGKRDAKFIDFGAVLDPKTDLIKENAKEGYLKEMEENVPVYYKVHKTMARVGNKFQFVYKNEAELVSTEEYASPEVLEDSRYSDRSDIYALGKTFDSGYRKDLHLNRNMDNDPLSTLNPTPRAAALSKELIKHMTAQELTDRPDIHEVLACLNTIKLDYLYSRLLGNEIATPIQFRSRESLSDFKKDVQDLLNTLFTKAAEILERGNSQDKSKVLDPSLFTITGYSSLLLKKLKERGIMKEQDLAKLKQNLKEIEENRLVETAQNKSQNKAILPQFAGSQTKNSPIPPKVDNDKPRPS